MKPRSAALLGQAAIVVALGLTMLSAARDQARSNALTSFRHYRQDWEESWRTPVEQLAAVTLARQLPHPEQDPELVEAALSVMRRSLSWYMKAPRLAQMLREGIELRIAHGEVNGDALHTAFDMLEFAESDEVDTYRGRIASLAGDRNAAAAALAEAASKLQSLLGMPGDDQAVARLGLAWRDLLAVHQGRTMNWLARQLPVIAAAEREATEAMVAQVRALLEPYLGKAPGGYGETLPDEAMLAVLERQSVDINRTQPRRQESLRQARLVLAECAPHYHFEPVIDAACTIALRYHAIPSGGLLIVLSVCTALIVGLWYAITRLFRGPMPVDVNAETMENVEPIDLDTDAETKSRSSGSITDIG